MTLDDLRRALEEVPQREWLTEAEARVRAEPEALELLFARAERKLGKQPVGENWTAGQAGRALLLEGQPGDIVRRLYEHGDANEKLAVLKALPMLDVGDEGLPLLLDALRTNDTRLVSAALGPYARHLDAATWRQGVIKCVFMGIPLAEIADLDGRKDQELAFMLRGLADERAAAGRDLADDAAALLKELEKR